MSKEVVTMASTDAMRERIAAHPWPRGGVEVIRANSNTVHFVLIGL
jgi:hypothetical protein